MTVIKCFGISLRMFYNENYKIIMRAIVVQWVKPLSAVSLSCLGVHSGTEAPLLVQLPVYMPEKVEEDVPCPWASVPMWESQGVGFQFLALVWPSPIAAIWGVIERMECLSPCMSPSVTDFQINLKESIMKEIKDTKHEKPSHSH